MIPSVSMILGVSHGCGTIGSTEGESQNKEVSECCTNVAREKLFLKGMRLRGSR